jgi:hypothetical protein
MATNLNEALEKGVEWLDAAEEHLSVRVEVEDGLLTVNLLLDKKFPGLVQSKVKDEAVKIPIPEYIDKIFPTLSIEIEAISLRKWIRMEEGALRFTRSNFESFYKTAPNERQAKDRDDYALYCDLSSRLKEKLFPIWRQVATGARTTTWTSAQSTDALTFFCTWLICKEPTATKAQFFFDATEEEITQELDNNFLLYTQIIDDNEPAERYLIGDDLPAPEELDCFRARWPALVAVR